MNIGEEKRGSLAPRGLAGGGQKKPVRNEKTSFAAVAALTTPAHAAGCDEATIRGVARGGSVVVLESGGSYNVERKLCTLLNNCGA